MLTINTLLISHKTLMDTLENTRIVQEIIQRFRGTTLNDLENYISSVSADLYKVKEAIQMEKLQGELISPRTLNNPM